MNVLLLIVGVTLLYWGGDLLVKNAVRLARGLGVSSLVIGLTVVAFGTSAPELAATLVSTLQGFPQLALGNVVGSNIANLGLILGLTALVYPLQGGPTFVRRELPVGIAMGLLLTALLWNGEVGRLEGLGLVVLLGVYLFILFNNDDVPAPHDEFSDDAPPTWRSLLLVALGVVVLVVGARALVAGAVALARAVGVPEEVIGLTLVAFGTSLPELASSVVAAVRRETDIILGNIVGSNIFNVLGVLGVTALVAPVREPFAAMVPDLAVMIGFSLAIIPLMLRRQRLGRRGGGLLLVAYSIYVVYRFAV